MLSEQGDHKTAHDLELCSCSSELDHWIHQERSKKSVKMLQEVVD